MLDRMRSSIHESNDDMRFVICYGTSAQPNEELSTEDQAKYENIKNDFCNGTKRQIGLGNMW